jgi:hypothetical protein
MRRFDVGWGWVTDSMKFRCERTGNARSGLLLGNRLGEDSPHLG